MANAIAPFNALDEEEDSPDVTSAPLANPSPQTDESTPTALPSLHEFLTAVAPKNPDMATRDLAQYWNTHYGQVDPATLPTLETFLPEVKAQNPDASDDELKTYWDDHYGSLGALEKPPPGSSVLRRAADVPVGLAKGLVDLPKAALGLADIATAGYAGEGATVILDAMGGASDTIGLPAWARPSQWSQQLRDLYSKETKENLDAVSEQAKAAEAEAKASGSGTLGQIAASAGGAAKGLFSNPGAIIPLAAENYGGMKAIASVTAKFLKPLSTSLDAAVKAGSMTVEEANAALGKAAIKYASAGEGVLTAGQVSSGISTDDPSADFAHRLAAVLAGTTTAVIARGASKIPGLGDVEATMATSSLGKSTGFQGSLPVRVGKGVISEGVIQEPLQSGQEQALQNIGASQPWQKGVGEQVVQGAAAGGALGGTMAGVSGRRQVDIASPEPDEWIDQAVEDVAAGQPIRLEATLPQQPVVPAPTIDDILAAPDVDTAIAHAEAMVSAAPGSASVTPEAIAPTTNTVPIPRELVSASEQPLQPSSVLAQQAVTPLEQGFTPQQEPEPDPRAAIQAERERLIAMRDAVPRGTIGTPAVEAVPMPTQHLSKRLLNGSEIDPLKSSVSDPTPSQQFEPQLLGLDTQEEAPSKPLPSAADKAYPSVDDIHAIADSRGIVWNGDAKFMAFTEQITGKQHLDALEPAERLTMANALQSVEQPTPMPSQPNPSELKAVPAALQPHGVQDTQSSTETAPTPQKSAIQAEKAKLKKPRAEKPSESYRLLPVETRTSFEGAWTGAETTDRPSIRTLKEWLDPGNKTLRAEFERRTGVKLPKSQAATNEAVKEYFKKAVPTGEDIAPVPSEAQPVITAQASAKPKAPKPEQLGIEVPPTQIAGQPIIGHEVDTAIAVTEAPLFSKEAQTPNDVQTSLPESASAAPIRYDRIPSGTMVNIKGIRASTGEEITVQEDAVTALYDLDASLIKYKKLQECLSA